MKTVMIMFILMTNFATAQTLAKCHPMSKNPKCWEVDSSRNDTLLNTCHTSEICAKIKTVNIINNAQTKASYECIDFNNKNFDCSKLVDLYGTNLYGLKVKLKVNSIDTCHIPGACGQRACVEHKYSFLDSQCQEKL